MISNPDFLQGQLNLYGEQAGELAPSIVPNAAVMTRRAIDQLVDFGLGLLRRIQRENELWAADVEAGRIDFSWSDSEFFADRYRQWKQMSDRILNALRECEKLDDTDPRFFEFRQAYRDVCLMALDTDRTKGSIESLDAGRGLRHDEAIHELRSRMG